jgi:hypothetical protein
MAQTLMAVMPATAFTLVWTHSVEKTEWRESWRIEDGRLRPVEAAISGSGAGMEPPPGAVLIDQFWRYVPATPPMTRLLLANSRLGEDYALCWDGACHSLASLLPAHYSEPIELYPCDAPDSGFGHAGEAESWKVTRRRTRQWHSSGKTLFCWRRN